MRRWVFALLSLLAFVRAGDALAQGGQISPCPLVTHLKLVPDATYTVSTTDYCWWIVFTNPGAISVSLPAPGLIFPPAFWTTFLTLGGGTVSLSGLQDTAGNVHKINQLPTITLSPGQGANLKVEEDLNWYAFTTGGTGGGGGGGCVGFGCLIPLGLGFTTAPGVDNQTPLTIGVDTLFGQTFDSDTTAASYTFAQTDVGHLKTFSAGSAQAATLPTAGTTGFERGNLVCFLVTGAGGLTLSAQSGVLLGLPNPVFIQGGNACAEAAPPDWKVSGANPASGTLTSVSITATPCITATPNPIVTTGTISTVIPFSVPCGGTGDTTLTNHSVLLGAGTLPVGFATVGTIGRVLTDNGGGANPTFQALPGCSSGASGLVPPTGGGTANFLRADCTFSPAPGGGTVTSVAQTVPVEFTITGSPITGAGTLAIGKATEAANTVWAGPTTGAAAQPTFRGLVFADLPSLPCASGAAGLVPATGGGTTNFLRADCTFAAIPSGGTVTSVAQTVPVEFIITGSPITTSGTLAITKATETANTVWAGPTSGGAAVPTFRAAVCADLPAGGCPFDVAMTWNGIPASYTNCITPTDSCVNVAITRAVSCPAAFSGSVGLAQEASTGTAVVNVNQITSGVATTRGTVTFTASATGVFASGSGMTLASGDLVQFAFPTTADATLGDIAITLKCTRT